MVLNRMVGLKILQLRILSCSKREVQQFYENQCTWGPHDKNGEGIIPRVVLLPLSPESGSELRNKRPNLISLAKLETRATDLLLFVLSG